MSDGFKAGVKTATYYLLLYLLFYVLLFGLRSLYGHPQFEPFNVSIAPWYLLALAIFIGSLPLVASAEHGAKLVIPLTIAISVLAGFDANVGPFMTFGRLINFAPFYYAGFYLEIGSFTETIRRLKIRPICYLLAVGVLIAAFVVVYLLPNTYSEALLRLSSGYRPYEKCGDVALPVLVALRFAWFAIATVLGMCVCVLVPEKKCVVSDLGTRTLQVYILHVFVYYALNGFGIMKAFAQLRIPYQDLMVIMLAVILAVLLAIPQAPANFFAWMKRAVSKWM